MIRSPLSLYIDQLTALQKELGATPGTPRPTMRGRRALSSHEPHESRKPRGARARGVDNFPSSFILSSRERVSLCNTSKISNTEMNYLRTCTKNKQKYNKKKGLQNRTRLRSATTATNPKEASTARPTSPIVVSEAFSSSRTCPCALASHRCSCRRRCAARAAASPPLTPHVLRAACDGGGSEIKPGWGGGAHAGERAGAGRLIRTNQTPPHPQHAPPPH